MWRIALVSALLFLTSCNEQKNGDQLPISVQEVISAFAEQGDLGAKAIIASGLYDSLSRESYPFVLTLVRKEQFVINPDNKPENTSDDTLKNYVTEQGLTDAEFLNHPKLRDFMESHLIPKYIPLGEIRTTKNGQSVYEAVNGMEIVFTTGENIIPADGDVVFANGIPFESYCFFDGDHNVNGGTGQICYADAPLAINFDWSE